MKQHLVVYGRKLVVCITATVYSFHYWINLNIWMQEPDHFWQYLHLTIINLIFIPLFWCFIVMLTTDPGTPTKADERTFQPFSRKGFCIQCKQPKPDRCHHCSICDRCVLQMDHHCPWINTCVGYQNRKQFVLLLLYALLFNSFTFIGTVKQYILQFNYSILNVIYALACLSNWILAFQLAIFLKYHIELLHKNQTTLEDIINKRNQIPYNIYDVGEENNIRQLFGSNKFLWIFPLYTAEGCDDGNSFPLKNELQFSTPQITHIMVEQHNVTSDKTRQENPIIQRVYQREDEKKKLNEIIKQ